MATNRRGEIIEVVHRFDLTNRGCERIRHLADIAAAVIMYYKIFTYLYINLYLYAAIYTQDIFFCSGVNKRLITILILNCQ